MVVAVAKAVEAGAKRDRLRVDRQHLGLGRGLRRGRRAGRHRRSCPRARSRSASCSRRSSPGRRSWRSTATSTRRCTSSAALAEQDDHPVTLVNSVNPFRLDGQKTGRVRDLRRPGPGARHPGHPGRQCRQHQRVLGRLPRVRRRRASSTSTPLMWGFQAAGAAPLVHGRRVEHPETVATAIRIGDPASWELAVAARDESRGTIESVTDDEILAAYRDLARTRACSASPRRRPAWPGCAR